MADIMLIRRGGGLVPVNQSDVEALEKIPFGKELRGQITQMRNGKFHRLTFALLNLAFQYWEPEILVTTIERNTVVKLGKFMVAQGLPAETAKTFCREFMEKLNTERSSIEADRSFEAFRDHITVEAGFYRTVQTPGGLRREPMSISYAAMDESKFREYYAAIFGVTWRLVLSKSFPTEEVAQNAVDQLLSFG